jgi:hypothetical protein
MDANTAAVVLGVLSFANTAVLAYVAIRTNQTHTLANGARDAAVVAAEAAGVVRGLALSTTNAPRPGGPDTSSTG